MQLNDKYSEIPMKNSASFFIALCVLAGVLLAGCGEKEKAEPAAIKESSTQAANDQTTAQPVNTDTHPGKALHDANCISCHDSTMYTREDRRVADFPQLVAQVVRCDANLAARLSDDEIKQIADYLNQAYYQYGK